MMMHKRKRTDKSIRGTTRGRYTARRDVAAASSVLPRPCRRSTRGEFRARGHVETDAGEEELKNRYHGDNYAICWEGKTVGIDLEVVFTK
jgi:hypothetical protein